MASAQAALDARNARYRLSPGRQSTDEEEAAERVKGRIEQAERAVEKFVTRKLKAVQPGLQKVRPQALEFYHVSLIFKHLPLVSRRGTERAFKKFVPRRPCSRAWKVWDFLIMVLQRLFLSFMRCSMEFGYSFRRVLLVPGYLMTWLSVVVLIPMLPASEAHFWARCKIRPLWSVYPLHQAQFRT